MTNMREMGSQEKPDCPRATWRGKPRRDGPTTGERKEEVGSGGENQQVPYEPLTPFFVNDVENRESRLGPIDDTRRLIMSQHVKGKF
jgi:hypothetical protein